MSDTIPRFLFGDRVRVMQTTDMEKNGLANRRGTVTKHQRTPSNLVCITLDECDHEEVTVEVPASVLMRITAVPIQVRDLLEAGPLPEPEEEC